ncbi:hypothetical protein B0H17DRAFT_927537 [Mycena rosella]|uniref:DUF6593 domain-containing protein n=1 Tax=Mycena rosella TaxID=1033263 RepID=A0AAD7DRS1_MYCRO|nr:hypothetical protein B0H17DRAFT_927537 [Mycena rosella]
MSHLNPYSTWSNSNGSRAAPGAPVLHGVLPFAGPASASNLVSFYFTAFNPTILNSTVIGRNTHPYYKVTTDASLPGYSAVKNPDGKVIALVEWKDRPLVEVRNVFSKRRVSDWLALAPDGSHRVMKVNGQRYIWAPKQSTICLYPAGTLTPKLLGRICRGDDGTVSLELTSTAVTAGLLEACVVATVLLQCGHNID